MEKLEWLRLGNRKERGRWMGISRLTAGWLGTSVTPSGISRPRMGHPVERSIANS